MTPGPVLLLAVLAALPGKAPADRTLLDALLQRAGDYVVEYERDASGVVLDESYRQSVRRGTRTESRLLRSDFVLVSLARDAAEQVEAPETGVLGFRDVYEVDGEAVRDRAARLETLFLHPTSEGLERVREILDEGARYNLGATVRNFNFPTVALLVLRPEFQGRFVFKDKGGRTTAGRAARRVEYEETSRPTLVRDPVRDEDQPSRGSFVLDLETGAVLESEFRIEERRGRTSMEVKYRWDGGLELWLPSEMTETNETLGRQFVRVGNSLRAGGGEVQTAMARYAKPRRFGVTTEEKIVPPPASPDPPR